MSSNPQLDALLEGQELTEEQIIAITRYLEGSENPVLPTYLPRSEEIALIHEKLAVETDWRRRAALAARIVSINLD